MEGNMKIVAVIPGGGLRTGAFVSGVLSGAQIHARHFDSIYACSAGAVTAAYLVANQATTLAELWINRITGPGAFSLRNLMRIGWMGNTRHMVRHDCADLNWDAVLTSSINVWVGVLRLQDGSTRYYPLTGEHASKLLMATCSIPRLDEPVEVFPGELFCDGGVEHAMPIAQAYEAQADRYLVFDSQPLGTQMRTFGSVAAGVVFGGHNGARRALMRQASAWRRAQHLIKHPPRGADVLHIAPPRHLPARLLDRSPARVRKTFDEGRRIGWRKREEIHTFLNGN